ncbi:MAG TPA: sigma factor-like helix-turn-helix DNA-binding protein [Streptomyces sp.]
MADSVPLRSPPRRGVLPVDDDGSSVRAGADRTAPSCAQLPASAREVLLLVHFGGQTVGEAAELLGLPEATVIRRLNDALSSLRHSGLGPAADPQTEAAEASVPRQREDA